MIAIKVCEVSMKYLECDVNTMRQKQGELQLLNERFRKMEEDQKDLDLEISSYEEENSVWRRRYKDYEKSKSERGE